MADQIVFTAQPRERTGKGGARTLRREGRIPAIVYGGGEPPAKISVPVKDIKRELDTNPRFFSTVFALELDGRRAQVLAREAQVHPVTDVPLHVDFIRATAGATITVMVPVHFANEAASPGIKRGGVLNIVRREVELACPADAIPAELTVDLTGLEIGDTVHFSAVRLPEGVRPTITDRDFTIASVAAPNVAREVAEPTAEEPTEAAG
jgi:large subunit ribosomal protein L25